MKFLRLLFSRFLPIILSILLQLTLFVLVTFVVSSYYQVWALVNIVITIVVLLLIINRDMDCEAKLPWAILVAVVPIVGFVAYITFSHNYASKRERRTFAKLPQIKLAEHHPNAPAKYLGQLNYLKSIGAPCFADTNSKYFYCGEDFFADLLQQLEKAKKFVFLEYFIVEHGKMLDSILQVLKRKIAEGVEVRLLYDDVGSLPHVKKSFCKKMKKLGINCARFAPLRPIASAIYNNRDHRKIAVIDGEVGYIGGINLADEYINHTHPFGYWKDTAVRLEGNAVATLCTMFLQMFDITTQQTEDFAPYMMPDEEKTAEIGIVAPFGDGPRPLYDQQIGKTVYLNLITQAVHELYITTPYLIVDDGFVHALCSAARRGVNVNIIIPGIPDKKSVYAMTKQSCNKLTAAGVNIFKYTAGFIHAKSIVADGIAGVVGTINLDYRSFVHHYECGVYMYDTPALREMYNDLVVTAQNSQLQKSDMPLNLWEKTICFVGHLFRPLL